MNAIPGVLAPSGGIPLALTALNRKRRPRTVKEIEEMLAGDEEELKTLYVHRPLKNAAELIAWARAAGFKKTLPPDDVHVTIAFSKTPLDWSSVQADDEDVHIDAGGPRTVKPLGDKGAVVLVFKSSELSQRWQQFRDAGASWDWPEYQAHVTVTYDAGDVDPSTVDPYAGPLDFGPEVFAEVDESWADKAKSGLVGDEFTESDHPRDNAGRFGSGGASGAIASTKEWLASKADTVSAVLTKENVTTAAKAAAALGIGALITKAAGMSGNWHAIDPQTEDFVTATIEHFAIAASVTTARAREVLKSITKAMIEDRRKGATDDTADDHVATLLGDAAAMLETKNQVFKVNGDALPLALDRDSVRAFDTDGRLKVKTSHICKACISPYIGHEIPDFETLGLDPDRKYMLLRDPEELQKALPTFNGLPLLRKHVPVTVDDHRPEDVIGSIGDTATWNEPYIDNSLTIWAREGVDGVESEEQRELSPAYRYRADMTPGIFDGKAFDGVMRDIVGNHVALVKDGRQGPDVIVGDSNEEIAMSELNAALAKKINAVANRTSSVIALHTYLKPRLAMDAKINYGKVFEGITGAKFKASKPVIAKRIREQAKLAKDASLDDVEKVLDMLDAHELEGGDESVSEKQHEVAGVAAELAPPKVVTEDDEHAPLKDFLKSKGMGEDDINAACSTLPKKTALDAEETEEEKKKREEKEAAEKAAKDAFPPKDDDKDKDKDKAMDKGVSKPAMDAAITAATDAVRKQVRETERGIRMALDEVRPYVGELPVAMAFDNGDAVRRHALVMLGVDGAKTIPDAALAHVLKVQKKAGAKPSQHDDKAVIGMDEAQVSKFNTRYPGAARIQTV